MLYVVKLMPDDRDAQYLKVRCKIPLIYKDIIR